MKKLILTTLTTLFFGSTAYAADLLDVYQQATLSDPSYQQQVAQTLATGEGVYISLANLLPSLNGVSTGFLSRQESSGGGAIFIGDNRSRGYTVALTANQTIFDFAQFSNFAEARSTAKQASASLNAAAQDLMLRVAKAYFQVLEDVDNLRSAKSALDAFAKQLEQTTEQYKVGIRTITEVYTAQASYEESVADHITAMNTLENDRENLRAITGKYYPSLAKLDRKFPLVQPTPTNINTWTEVARRQNWEIKAAQYGVAAAKANIKEQFSGHLPTLELQGSYNLDFARDFGTTTQDVIDPPGAGKIQNSAVALNVKFPIIQGGKVLALTRQAKENYRNSCESLEQQYRATFNQTRQNYLNVIAGIRKIEADLKAIQASKSSLEGMRAGYNVGTELLVNVLDQQRQVFINERVYARDRYAYINDMLALKKAAGTLCPNDIAGVNEWLKGKVILNSQYPTNVKQMIKGKPVNLPCTAPKKKKVKNNPKA